ncbi:MAG: MBOAT family protein [Clostridia bacterium]|nr:MBOAT family protein [Clostridia bacterium]
MVFSSIPFLYYFLPAVLLLYLIAPKKLKNTVLLISSLFFYGWGEPRLLIMILASIFAGYIFGLLIDRFNNTKRWLARIFLILSVSSSLLTLGYFKYADFLISSFNSVFGLSIPLLKIALPIGISFYTFQILSYTVDVYRHDAPVQKSFFKLATYIAMFPQLIAGPIVRYTTIAEQLDERTHSFEYTALGIRRFIIGLSKKVLLANTLGEVCSGFATTSSPSVLYTWLYAITFTLQTYFDFSGYSDMAIGLGKMFGFDFLENFNYPFISASITDFWRRWHISLGTWFRDYVYIPLGGNRVKLPRYLLNIFIVWALTGLWHGASWNFVLWGVYFGILLIIEKLFIYKHLEKTKGFLRIINHIYVFIFVLMSFVLFNAENIPAAITQIGTMFGFTSLPFATEETIYTLRNFGVLLALGVIASTPFAKNTLSKLREKSIFEKIINVLEPIVLLLLLLAVTAYLVDGSFNPFLYFRF